MSGSRLVSIVSSPACVGCTEGGGVVDGAVLPPAGVERSVATAERSSAPSEPSAALSSPAFSSPCWTEERLGALFVDVTRDFEDKPDDDEHNPFLPSSSNQLEYFGGVLEEVFEKAG